ncbi:hypothetical protein P3W75_04155, partial [Pseudomonas citronellolis]|nr:hypothetical protein [Pseudomonas citronellolis]
NVKPGGGGGVIVIFDNNVPQQRSMYPPKKIEGDLVIRKDYYPWVDKQFKGAYETQVLLAGEGDIFLTYKASNARKVVFEPNLHADCVVRSVWPQEQKLGSYIQFTYPDGSMVADGDSKPDFDKLQAIRLKPEKRP